MEIQIKVDPEKFRKINPSLKTTVDIQRRFQMLVDEHLDDIFAKDYAKLRMLLAQ